MIKLIASDMDGTLIGSNQTISPENLTAIQVAQQQGVKFAIATGRAYEDVKPFLDEYGLTCECVVLNGGEYRDAAGNVIEGIYIEPDLAQAVIAIMRSHGFFFEIYTTQGFYTFHTREEVIDSLMKRSKLFRPHLTNPEEVYQAALRHPHLASMNYLTDVNEWLKSDIKIGKFLSFADTPEDLRELRNHVEQLENIAVSSSFVTNIEINAGEATKGRMLAKVAAGMKIKTEEVAILGDGSNDYSMFAAFPYSFAMENALPEIKAAARYITASNVEHGVAQAIYRILDLR